MSVTAVWTEGMNFEMTFPGGERLVLDSVPQAERPGPGPGPMETVQAALAGCTGMDVVSILTKMRKNLKSLEIRTQAERREEEPRIYTRIVLTYELTGHELDEAAVKRAVELSQEKYCSVAAMLRPTVELDYRIVLNGVTVQGEQR